MTAERTHGQTERHPPTHQPAIRELTDAELSTIVRAALGAHRYRPVHTSVSALARAAWHSHKHQIVGVSIITLAATEHHSARACALADRCRGQRNRVVRGGLLRELTEAQHDMNVTLGDVGRSISQATTHWACRHGRIDELCARDVAATAIAAAGWDTWLTALAAHHQLGPVDCRAALEMTLAGTDFEHAIRCAALLT